MRLATPPGTYAYEVVAVPSVEGFVFTIRCDCGSVLQATTAGGLGLAIKVHTSEHQEGAA